MDPVTVVGLLASIGQVAAQTVTIVVSLSNYYRDVKDGPAQSKELRDEFYNVSELLDCLKKALANNPGVLVEQHAALQRSIAEFQNVLNELGHRIKPKRTLGIRRLKWPFSKAENETLISKLERYKATFSFALNISHTYAIVDYTDIQGVC
jgi:hypothetical protein